jgi:hypothetical protein
VTVDIRCEVYCRFGPVVEGRISDRKVDGSWLITTRGALVIDRIFNPRRGRLVDLSYRRGNRLAPFPRMLTVLRATPDPHRGVTVLDVGDPLELLADRKERVEVGAAADAAPSRKAPQPVSADAILQTCLSRLGLELASNSEDLTGQYLQESYDLSEGYVSVLQKLIESHSCYAYLTRNGRLRIRKLRLDQPEAGPLFTWQNLARIDRLQGASMPPDVLEVAYNGREAPMAATDGWYPTVDDGLGSVEDWTNALSGVDSVDNGYGAGFIPGLPAPDEDSFKYWEYERSVGSPDTIRITYANSAGVESTSEFSLLPVSESRTYYGLFGYYDQSAGRWRQREYTIAKSTTSNTTLAAANGAYVKWALENGVGAPNTALWNTSQTFYEYYDFTDEGPLTTVEATREYISGAQLAGSLGISDYTGVGLPAGTYMASETITTTTNSPNGGSSKVTVARRLAWGLTQEGNQAAASAAESGSPAAIQALIADMGAMVADGIEVRTSSNGQVAPLRLGQRSNRGGWQSPQSRPSLQELMADAIDPRGGDEKVIRKQFSVGGDDLAGIWQSPMNDSDDAVSLRVRMPLSPDDWFSVVDGGGTILRRGRATRAAQEYGEAVMGLKVGAAWGLSIMGEPWRLPSRPMDPIYVTFNGSTNCYRMDGMSWSFNGQGMAVGADTLLSGTVGEPGE